MRIFYQYSYLKSLKPTKGDQINEINTLKALSRFAEVYYSGQRFNPNIPGYGLKDYDGEIKVVDADISIIRANKDVFMRCKGRRIVMSTPYDEECFKKADAIFAFTNTWTEMLRSGSEILGPLNPDKIKWKKVVTFHQTLSPEFKDMRGHARTEQIKSDIKATFIIGAFGCITQGNYPSLLINTAPYLRILINRFKVLFGVTRNKYKQIRETNAIAVRNFTYKDMPYAISACKFIAPANKEPGWEYAGALRIIESMACGTPVLCQRSPAREEMLGKDYKGFLDKGFLIDNSVENIKELAETLMTLKIDRKDLISRAQFYSIEQNSKRLEQTLIALI